MADRSNPRARVLIIAAVIFVALAALIIFLSVRYKSQPVTPLALPTPGGTVESVTTPTPAASTTDAATPQTTPSPAPLASPSTSNSTDNTTPQSQTPIAPVNTSPPSNASDDASRPLIPVAGVRPEQLQDTFNDARSEGRVHDAIDIMAPRNTPVLAAMDGRIVKLFKSVKGGITIYQLGADERTVYYYAHLERYADGLEEGHVARRGETIGYVGDTGNAAPGNTHLHFQIYTITDPKHFWDGDNINPYPILRGNKN